MAREHLYKAKRKDNGEWLEGNLDKIVYEYPNKTVEEYYINETHFGFQDDDGFDPCYQCGFNEPVDENTICEYTGLKDKNGTRIFEGDIVVGTITSQGNKRLIHCEVVFENGCFISVETDGHHWSHKLKFAKDIEVIGNKFDNDLGVQDEQAN